MSFTSSLKYQQDFFFFFFFPTRCISAVSPYRDDLTAGIVSALLRHVSRLVSQIDFEEESDFYSHVKVLFKPYACQGLNSRWMSGVLIMFDLKLKDTEHAEMGERESQR